MQLVKDAAAFAQSPTPPRFTSGGVTLEGPQAFWESVTGKISERISLVWVSEDVFVWGHSHFHACFCRAGFLEHSVTIMVLRFRAWGHMEV